MLRRSHILSIIIVTALLIIQAVLILLLVDYEKNTFRKQFETGFKKAIANELRLRRNSKTGNRVIDFIMIDKKDYKQNQLYPNYSRYTVDSKDVGESDLFLLNVEHVYQAVLRKTNPLKLNILSQLLSKELYSLKMSADYMLEYSDVDTVRKFVNFRKRIHLGGNFLVFENLSATKDMKIRAIVYYPASVYKGYFLLISISSILLLVFIFYALIAQTRMLANQISITKIKENLTSFFTHELRSPLQSALTGVEMIENCAQKKEYSKIDFYTNITKEKLLYINNFIEKLLDVNKLKKRVVKLHREFFLLSEIIDFQINNCISLKEKDVVFEVDPSYKIEIFADKLHLSNAICNLFENAVKYSNKKVCIKIKVCKEGKYIRIVVEDNGIGIPLSHQERIFEQFYRVNESEHNVKSKGYGLGLNYVKWVAEEHGGKVTVESTEGIGSKFSIFVKNI
jgi:signal transduction histidine kinase